MKFATAIVDGRETVGLIQENQFIPLQQVSNGDPLTMLEAIQRGDEFINDVRAFLKTDVSDIAIPIESVTLTAPIRRPAKNIFCVGKNYAAHAVELGSEADIPEAPIFFSKTPTTVIGPNDPIPRHANVTDALDYEGELAVIIGKKGIAIEEEKAFDYIFGYTIINDITARDLQKRHQQFLLGKSLDGSCPMGPYIVHKSEIPNPQALKIETKVNGEVRQQATTEQLIFSIPKLISVLSQGMTIEPGDIIATGTPAGVGLGFSPPKLLKSGDVVEITIEKIGTLTNTIQ